MRWFILALLLAGPAQAAYSPDQLATTDSNATLRNIPSYATSAVMRLGFATPGDADPLVFLSSTTACSLNGGDGDGGSQVKSLDGKCWIADFPAVGADVRQWGAKPDAVPGAIGAACTGISGTDNTAAIQAAINYSFATGARVVAGGAGFYRTNTRLNFTGTTQYWDSNKKPPDIDFSQPLVHCGTDAALYFTSGVEGGRVHFAHVIGSGAASSAPTPGSHAEKVGAYFEGAAWWNVAIDAVSDFTYDVLLDGAYGNKLHVGSAIASYKAIYLRDGAAGTACVGCGSAANQITFLNVGGPYTASTDADFAARQARSSYWGLHLAGTGQGNNVAGGAAQYSVKPGGINLEVNSNENFISTWVEGHAGTGKNVVVTGADNLLRLSALTSPSPGMAANISITGIRNSLWAPLVTVNGTFSIGINNFINGGPTVAAYTPTISCTGGAPTTASGTGRYRRVGPAVWVEIAWTTTNIGTCTGALLVSLPAGLPASTTFSAVMSGVNLVSGASDVCRVDAGSSNILVTTTAPASFPAANAHNGICTGWYDIE